MFVSTRELINNIYQHANGSFIDYSLNKDKDHDILTIINDGTSSDQYDKIVKSKNGLMILRSMLEAKGASLNFDNNDGYLTAKVKIKVNHENNSIR